MGVNVQLRSATQFVQASTDVQGRFSIIGLVPEVRVRLMFFQQGWLTKAGYVPICVGRTLIVNEGLVNRMTYLFPYFVDAHRSNYISTADQYSVNPDPRETAWQSQC